VSLKKNLPRRKIRPLVCDIRVGVIKLALAAAEVSLDCMPRVGPVVVTDFSIRPIPRPTEAMQLKSLGNLIAAI